ncbi:LacI family transcriptional regulator [Flavobacteriales bacterium 34_180_T64]|nr:LacI family transcriptional regulator [Flavobacteriales bacterium 34_180_T64]
MVTLKELAKQLDVSISTVSKALHDSDEIGRETIIRVKTLAQQLNYKPNKVALSLKNQKTKTIGVIIPDILNHFFAKVLFGIEKEATKHGYNIITCLSNESLEKEVKSIELLTTGSADGLILALSEETIVKSKFTHFNKLKENNVPLVMFDRVLKDFECDKVIIDDFLVAQQATQFLIDKKRKNIAFISAIDELNVGKSRKAGFIKKINDVFKKEKVPLILIMNEDSNYHEELAMFFKNNSNVDGIISADNKLGTMALNIAKDIGYKIPSEMSIIGFADEMTSEMSTPKLSYVKQNAEIIGNISVRLLIDRLNLEVNDINYLTKIIPVEIYDKEI